MEVQKEKLIETAIRNEQLLTVDPISFQIAGVSGAIQLKGPHDRATLIRSFLVSYLQPFPCSNEKKENADFTIEYHIAPEDLASAGQEIWNEVSPEYRIRSRDNKSSFVIHRDFSAIIQNQNRFLKATGPDISFLSTDTIDNMLTLMFSIHLPKHYALPLHASTVERNGQAYVFFGASGAGKSTLARHCFDNGGFRILSGDQIYLRLSDRGLFAHATPNTIPEFPHGHHGWCTSPRPVHAIIHLVQRTGKFSYSQLSLNAILPFFLRETIYIEPSSQAAKDRSGLLDLAIEILHQNKLHLGEMSYPKGHYFWNDLDRLLEREKIHEKRKTTENTQTLSQA